MPLVDNGPDRTAAGRRVNIISYVSRGNSGDVYEVSDGKARYAMKVFFPYYALINKAAAPTIDVARLIDRVRQMQEREHDTLVEINHPNIVKVYGIGEIELTANERAKIKAEFPIEPPTKLPVLLSEYIDGWGLTEAIDSHFKSPEDIVYALQRLGVALRYLHEVKKFLHADIRPENVLIKKSDWEPVLIDFALTKVFDFSKLDSSEHTNLEGDWDLFPILPEAHPLKVIKERGGNRSELAKLSLPALDFFQFGKMLALLAPRIAPHLDRRELRFLNSIQERLTDWSAVSTMRVGELADLLGRLGADQFAPFGVPELGEVGTTHRSITLPPGIVVPTTPMVERLIETRSWRRLATIHQLSLLGLVYPGADYKRSVHVLYAYDLCRRLLSSLYGDDAFRLIFGAAEIRQALVATLLHDINHFPFLHIFQEMQLRKVQLPGFYEVDLIELFCDGTLTEERRNNEPSVYDLTERAGIDRSRLKRLLLGRYSDQTTPADFVIKSIIDSGVDVDKLSYLRLDSHFCGVSFGTGIDHATIIGQARLMHRDGSRTPHLAFSDIALQALENAIMTRFWNFRSIYWHHTNRAAMAMLLRASLRVFVEGGARFEDYLGATLWSGDLGALRYIDTQHQKILRRTSLVGSLPQLRPSLYRRLYTLRVNDEVLGEQDKDLLERLGRLNFNGEKKVCLEIAKELNAWIGKSRAEASEDDVLIDIPGRKMEAGGDVFVVGSSGRAASISRISEPIRQISSNYEKLAQRARFFVAPGLYQGLSAKFGPELRHSNRRDVLALIEPIVRDVARDTQFV